MYYPSGKNYPSTWLHTSTNTASNTALRRLRVTDLTVEYIGEGSSDAHAASIVTDVPVPADCPLYYFEVEVLDKGKEGFIGVGFAPAASNLAKLPGWEPDTYGYHGDDGHSFGGSGTGTEYGPRYSTGDVIGVLLNRAARTITYFKNGVDLGVAFRNVSDPMLCPVVGMKTKGERVTANLGATPFRGSFEDLRSEALRALRLEVFDTPVPLDGEAQLPHSTEAAKAPGGEGALLNDAVSRVVMDHLVHHGYSATAAVLSRDALSDARRDGAAQMASAAPRQAMREALRAGDVLGALERAAALVGDGRLERDPVWFKLLCQRFVELIRAGQEEEALAFAGEALRPACHSAGDREQLQEVLSLLAYSDCAASPCGHLLAESARDALSNELNSAVLRALGFSPETALERLYMQAAALHASLADAGDLRVSLVDYKSI